MKPTYYMHFETGSVDTKEGWIDSYSNEELQERGLTIADQAFDDDIENVNLIEVELVNGEWVEVG